MKEISGTRFYRATENAELIAHNGKFRRDREQSVYLTPSGKLYLLLETRWQGESNKFYELESSELEGLEQKYFTGSWNRKPKFNELLLAQIEREERADLTGSALGA